MDPEAAQPLIPPANALQTRPLTQIPSQARSTRNQLEQAKTSNGAKVRGLPNPEQGTHLHTVQTAHIPM